MWLLEANAFAIAQKHPNLSFMWLKHGAHFALSNELACLAELDGFAAIPVWHNIRKIKWYGFNYLRERCVLL